MESRVLVVEDERPVREVLETFLALSGFGVTGVSDGRSALRAMHDAKPDLLLLDVRMPDISGWDLLGLLRHDPDLDDVPVVMLSGMGDAVSQAYGWQLGCTCYLTKPIDLNDLLLVVQRVLSGVAPGPEAPGGSLSANAMASSTGGGRRDVALAG